MFKVGDKVVRKPDYRGQSWVAMGPGDSTVCTVLAIRDRWLDLGKANGGEWADERFNLYVEPELLFKVGDKVVSKKGGTGQQPAIVTAVGTFQVVTTDRSNLHNVRSDKIALFVPGNREVFVDGVLYREVPANEQPQNKAPSCTCK